jgi:PPOX class probable FMN-dependent enzyme
MVRIMTVSEVRKTYPRPEGAAVQKRWRKLDRFMRAFIERSPFLCLGTANAAGKADVSPRGDPPGFVQILDDETLLIPDRPGNNHLDSIENIIANPNVGLIFFVPGSEETLRVNGRGRVVDDPSLLAATELHGKAPKAGIEVSIGEVFLHCPKALKRSRLWDPSQHADRASFPYLGRLILEQTSEFATPREIGAAESLEKAKELCRRDSKAWSLDDFESGVSGVTMLTVVADDNERKAYLKRAKALLEQKQPVRTAAYPIRSSE